MWRIPVSTLESCSRKIAELTELLKQESKLLKEGRIDGLQDVINKKASGMADLEKLMQALDDNQNLMKLAPRIGTLKRMADENGTILKSVMNGLKSARERLKALQSQDAKVGAYSRSGSRIFISDDQFISEKRI